MSDGGVMVLVISLGAKKGYWPSNGRWENSEWFDTDCWYLIKMESLSF